MNKIAVLSNVTIDLVVSKLDKDFEIYIPEGFDTWQQEVYNCDSSFYKFLPEAVFVILYVDPYDENWQTLEKRQGCMQDWQTVLRLLATRMERIPIFVSSLDIMEIQCGAVSDSINAAQIESEWIKGAKENDNMYILPLKEKAAEIGRSKFYSRKMWYLGNAPYSLKGSTALAELIKCHFFYTKGNKKKCFVVDLDNTLWGGVIGEDGVDGIVLTSHREGGRYYDTQKCLKRIQESGVMLAVISKNNLEDVEPVFKNPYMLLKENDFVCLKINWKSKSQNIKELARELNIGLDSFVFLDDNPAEREEMKMQCPEVEVLDFPQDTTLLPRVVETAYNRFFKSLYVTQEDKDKTKQYRLQTKRTEIQRLASSVEDYLHKLEIRVDIHLMGEAEIKRAVQLAGKTNQFNTTTIRYSERQIEQIQNSSYADIVVAYMQDKFGEEGLTALAVVTYERSTATIEAFIMSCRVMGRQFENVIMDEVVKRIRLVHPEIKNLRAEYVKTAKNQPVEGLYEGLGFYVVETSGDECEVGYIKRYEVEIKKLDPFISRYKEIQAFREKE